MPNLMKIPFVVVEYYVRIYGRTDLAKLISKIFSTICCKRAKTQEGSAFNGASVVCELEVHMAIMFTTVNRKLLKLADAVILPSVGLPII
jgi:hypothetical protein